jgi:predicted RND superfamily exporter protein
VSLIPNLLPLIIGAAAMSLLSIKVSFASAMVFSVCLGIVVDDTIHFLLQFKNYLREKKNTKQAIEAVLYTSGTSIFITTILLAIGFGLFAFAQFVLNVDFGIIAAVIFISALIADLIFLPALLLLMEPNHDS